MVEEGCFGAWWRSHARNRWRRGALLVALALVSPLIASRAAADPPPPGAPADASRPAATGEAGCTKDTDCKGDRLCNSGRCMEPRSAADFAYGPTPADSASGGPPVSARDLRVNASLLEATAYNAQTLQANHQGCDATIAGASEQVSLRQQLAETCNRWVDSEAMWNRDDAWTRAAPTASSCQGSTANTAPTGHQAVCSACTEPLDATIAALRADAARLRTMASIVDCTVSGGKSPVVAPVAPLAQTPPSPPESTPPPSPHADEAKDEPAPTPYRRNVPDSGLVLDARGSYDFWLTGTVAGQSVGSVFAPGMGIQLDAGLILSRGVALYLGWEHTMYGAGSQNPYVAEHLPNVSARAEYFMFGIRVEGCKDPDDLVNAWFAADLGYEILHSQASDNFGGSAGVDLGNLEGRVGVGVCVRPTSGLVITPALMASLLMEVGGQSSSVTVNGQTTDTSSDVSNKSLIVGLAPGAGVQGEF